MISLRPPGLHPRRDASPITAASGCGIARKPCCPDAIGCNGTLRDDFSPASRTGSSIALGEKEPRQADSPRRFTAEVREQAVAGLSEPGPSKTSFARRRGVAPPQLAGWRPAGTCRSRASRTAASA
ncbi:transposase [Mangrovicoccus ximenensis]|uniref:transposase n=1 Tax=Mangrovicoccus ximenensis TaxID=1911570 RepID=UPI0038B3E185